MTWPHKWLRRQRAEFRFLLLWMMRLRNEPWTHYAMTVSEDGRSGFLLSARQWRTHSRGRWTLPSPRCCDGCYREQWPIQLAASLFSVWRLQSSASEYNPRENDRESINVASLHWAGYFQQQILIKIVKTKTCLCLMKHHAMKIVFLCLIKDHAIHIYGRVEVTLRSFLTTILNGSGCWNHALAALPPVSISWAPEPVWMGWKV
jgi:hypothetical protein